MYALLGVSPTLIICIDYLQAAIMTLRARHTAVALLDTLTAQVPASHHAFRALPKKKLSKPHTIIFTQSSGDTRATAIQRLYTNAPAWKEVYPDIPLEDAISYLVRRRAILAKNGVVDNEEDVPPKKRRTQAPTDLDFERPGVVALLQTAAHWRGANWKDHLLPLAIAGTVEHAHVQQTLRVWMNPVLVEFRRRIVEAVKSTRGKMDFQWWDRLGESEEYLKREVPEWIASGIPPQRATRDAILNAAVETEKPEAAGMEAGADADAEAGPESGAEAGGSGAVAPVALSVSKKGKGGKAKGKGKEKAVAGGSTETDGKAAHSMKVVEKSLAAISRQLWAKAITSGETRMKERKQKGLDRMMYDALGYTWKVSCTAGPISQVYNILALGGRDPHSPVPFSRRCREPQPSLRGPPRIPLETSVLCGRHGRARARPKLVVATLGRVRWRDSDPDCRR